MPSDGTGSTVAVVDLSRRPRAWIPSLSFDGRPAEAALYRDLVEHADMRLTRDEDGTPRLHLTDGSVTTSLPVPSTELVEFLDTWRVRRNSRLLSERVIADFCRLVKARVRDPAWESDDLGPRELWNERFEPARPVEDLPDPYVLLVEAIMRMVPHRVFALRPSDLALVLGSSDTEVVGRVVRFHERLQRDGIRVVTVGSALGPLFIVHQTGGQKGKR